MKLFLVFILFLTLSGPAWSSSNVGQCDRLDYQSQSDALYSYSDVRYSFPRIHVCWEPSNMPSDSDKFKTFQSIYQAYERNTSLHFVGWQTCQNSASDPLSSHIRILSSDERSHTDGVGKEKAGKPNNMVLNYQFVKNHNECLRSTAARDFCIKAIAVHEFGHALSSIHEQTRPDTPSWCTEWGKSDIDAPDFDYDTYSHAIKGPYITDWDVHSAMNYCNSSNVKWKGVNYTDQYGLQDLNGGNLSPIDLQNWRAIYGSSKSYYSLDSAAVRYSGGTTFGFGDDASYYHPAPAIAAPVTDLRKPDLFFVIWGLPTGSGKAEVHALTSDSNYQNYSIHTTIPIPAQTPISNTYGHSFVNRGAVKPDLVYLINNTSSRTLEVHSLDGNTNWQSTTNTPHCPVSNTTDAKLAFGDYDGDGVLDLYVITSLDGQSSSAYVQIMQGPHWFKRIGYGSLGNYMSPATQRNCQWVAGNFHNYNKTPGKGFVDLLCLERNTTSNSSSLFMRLFLGREDYSTLHDQGETQFIAEDGSYGNFGIWNRWISYDKNDQSNKSYLPGDGYGIGYARGNSSSNKTEVHFLNPSLYLY